MNIHKLDRKLLDLKVEHPLLFDLLAVIIALVVALLVACISGHAADAPVLPVPVARARTVDREFKIDAAALAVSWGLDLASTQSRFSWCDRHYGTRLGYQPDCFESGGFFDGTRSTAKIMGAWAAVDLVSVAVSYEWKRRVTNRYLHPLWRVPLIVGSQGHLRAAVSNWSYPRP